MSNRPHSDARVDIVENGRDGKVIYRDHRVAIEGYFEFGGGADVITIVRMGAREEWDRSYRAAVADRPAILRFVADEAIRLKAPSCYAEIQEETGTILLRISEAAQIKVATARTATVEAQTKAAKFVRRYGDLRATLAVIVLGAAMIAGGIYWMSDKVLTVAPAIGVPLNEAAYFTAEPMPGGGVAALIQATDPHAPNWTGRGGGETSSLSILIVPLNGAEPRLVRVARGLSSGAFSLARIIGSDGRTLWFDAAGLYGVRLSDNRLVAAKDLAAANPGQDATWWDDPRHMDIVDGRLHVMRADRSAALDVDPENWAAAASAPKPSNARFRKTKPQDQLATGVVMSPSVWLGLLSQADLATGYQRGKWILPVESAEDKNEPRRMVKAELAPNDDKTRYRITSVSPLADAEYRNAAFLRADDKSEPIRLGDPGGALMLHTAGSILTGTLVVSRIDATGAIVWSEDTGLDRFKLKQIFPGPDAVAFVGDRPPVPGKLSEPLIVVVDVKTGQRIEHTMWR
jgi:hypothetical protein